ncbi:MAG: YggS family pyridoxal phosphate-dependent enzyme [Steroidobacteraceae bacterium]
MENIAIQGLAQVRNQIAAATRGCGRPAGSVSLLAVSKQQSVAAMRAVAAAGQRDFGESYLQEALAKMQALQDLDLCWHFIGQMQSNKTRPVAEHFQWVHTLDRDKIATRLNEQRPHYAPPLQVCIQVKLADEAGKGGIWPEAVPSLAQHVLQLPRLNLRGLMCIPPPATEYAMQLAQFRRLQDLLTQLNTGGLGLDTLSMGMSGDYAAAIAAGATLVRIGTAVFGARQ